MCDREPEWLIGRPVFLTGLCQFRGGDRPTSDCGFFAGMALKLLSDGAGNPETREITRREVYAARDAYLGIEPGTGQHGHGHSLDEHNVVPYLQHLGLAMNYHYRDVSGVRDVWHHMHDYMSPWRGHGLMIRILDRVMGHWATVLALGERDGQAAYHMYDSSGILGNPERSVDWCSVARSARSYPRVLGVVTPRRR